MKLIITCGVSDDLKVSKAIVNPFCLERGAGCWLIEPLVEIVA